jgi:hypothetical protein
MASPVKPSRQLLDAGGQRYVVDAGGDSVASVAEGVGGGGAGVLHAGDGYVVKLEGLGQGLAGAEAAHSAQPGGLDVVGADAGVLVGLVAGLHHQVQAVRVPTLAELGAPHAHDGDSVLYPFHDLVPL